MQRLSFDAYESDTTSSEESLDLALSSARQHPTLAAFLAECGASSQAGESPPADWCRWEWVVETVRLRTGLELPPIRECRVVLLSDDWDDVEMAVVSGSVLVWYHWWTTA
jgi:hypothetical protein